MIIVFAVMLIVILILAVGLWNEVNKNKGLQLEVNNLKASNSSLLEQAESLKENKEKPSEHGRFVKHRALRKPTARTYQLVFDVDPNGQRIIEHLASLFCRNAFVPDDKGGERETSRRLGEQNVVNFILSQINKANDPNYEEEVNE